MKNSLWKIEIFYLILVYCNILNLVICINFLDNEVNNVLVNKEFLRLF